MEANQAVLIAKNSFDLLSLWVVRLVMVLLTVVQTCETNISKTFFVMQVWDPHGPYNQRSFEPRMDHSKPFV